MNGARERELRRSASAADAGRGFEHDDPSPRLRDDDRGRKPVGAGADDDGIDWSVHVRTGRSVRRQADQKDLTARRETEESGVSAES